MGVLHRTFGSSGYCDRGVQNSQKLHAGTRSAVSVLRVLWRGCVQKLQMFWVRV